MNAAEILQGTTAVIPAFNEERALGVLLAELRERFPGLPVTVVDDGSCDGTAAVARAGGARLLSLPCNLGVGGAVQAGFRDALQRGYSYVVRLDGDGQHPPAAIADLAAGMAEGGADLIVGSRFGGGGTYMPGWYRSAGIELLARFLSLICRQRISDPTSGFWMLNRPLLHCFANTYPVDYPEPEALALLRRQGYSFREVPVAFRPRQAGQSTIQGWDTAYFALKVGLALLVDRMRQVDPRLAREHTGRRL